MSDCSCSKCPEKKKNKCCKCAPVIKQIKFPIVIQQNTPITLPADTEVRINISPILPANILNNPYVYIFATNAILTLVPLPTLTGFSTITVNNILLNDVSIYSFIPSQSEIKRSIIVAGNCLLTTKLGNSWEVVIRYNRDSGTNDPLSIQATSFTLTFDLLVGQLNGNSC
jgi:hypothetical protein